MFEPLRSLMAMLPGFPSGLGASLPQQGKRIHVRPTIAGVTAVDGVEAETGRTVYNQTPDVTLTGITALADDRGGGTVWIKRGFIKLDAVLNANEYSYVCVRTSNLRVQGTSYANQLYVRPIISDFDVAAVTWNNHGDLDYSDDEIEICEIETIANQCQVFVRGSSYYPLDVVCITPLPYSGDIYGFRIKWADETSASEESNANTIKGIYLF